MKIAIEAHGLVQEKNPVLEKYWFSSEPSVVSNCIWRINWLLVSGFVCVFVSLAGIIHPEISLFNLTYFLLLAFLCFFLSFSPFSFLKQEKAFYHFSAEHEPNINPSGLKSFHGLRYNQERDPAIVVGYLSTMKFLSYVQHCYYEVFNNLYWYGVYVIK